MRISKEAIDSIKRAYDLREVVESHGIKLRKKGSSYVGLCPFHKEKTPSFTVNPKTNLYHCFGCNAGGDVIGFVCKTEGIGFRDAMEKLSNGNNGKKTKPKKAPSPSRQSNVSRTYLLNRVVSFYHKTFCEDTRAMEYLKSRGITDNSIFTDFQIGYSNGTLLNTIPDEGDIYDTLKEIGILNNKGHEMFYSCVVFPVFNENKDCVGLYGRRIEDGEVNHLYLPGPRKGVFNHQAVKRSKSIIFTESIIDALSLYNAGFKDVIPCYGVNGLIEDHLNLFTKFQTKEVYICFDKDEAGERASERIAKQLSEKKNITPYIVKLPQTSDGKTDINTFFVTNTDAALIFEGLMKQANPRVSIKSDRLIKQETRHYEKTDTGFIVQYGERRYEVKGITKEGIKLKATIKAVEQHTDDPEKLRNGTGRMRKHRFHLDTVDLYSNRSRLYFAKACAVFFSEKEELITEDITKLIDLCESWKAEDKDTVPTQKMTKTEEDEALEFLKEPSLFNRILEDFETIGLTGEEANKLMGYIAATERMGSDWFKQVKPLNTC